MDAQKMRANILDELVFVPSQMPAISPVVAGDTSLALAVRENTRSLRIGSPWFARDMRADRFGKSWNSFCSSLRAADIPIYASCKSLEAVTAAAVPKRYARRFSNEPFSALELKTADAFELDCRDRSSLRWAWPAEFDSETQLATFVQTVRNAAGGTAPIGIGLPVGVSMVDLQKCQTAQVDFLILNDDCSSLAGDAALLIESLATARRFFTKHQQPSLPIFVVAELASIEDAIKLLALGATAISIDGLLNGALAMSKSKDIELGGMLSGIGAAQAKEMDFAPVKQLFDSLSKKLDWQLKYANAASLSGFDSSALRAITDRASRLSGTQMLRG